MPPPADWRLLYLACVPRSGSTLLSLLLDQHPRVTAAGEAESLGFLGRRPEAAPCTCGALLPDCPHWRAVLACYAAVLGEPVDGVLQRHDATLVDRQRVTRASRLVRDAVAAVGSRTLWHATASASSELERCRAATADALTLLGCVATATAADVVTDASKSAVRLRFLWLAAPGRVRVVHLVRDGRAICWSRMRRTGCGMATAVRAWLQSSAGLASALRGVPSDHVLPLRYETLCAQPQAEVERICAWLGLEPVPGLDRLRHASHVLGGNPMRYRQHETAVQEDTAWQAALSAADLRTFERLGGWWNRRLGYGEAA